MLQLIWRLCTFRARPDEVPYSVYLLLAKLTIHFCVLTFIIAVATSSLEAAVWRSAIFIGLLSLYSLAWLRYYQFPERFVQVLSGMLATMAMILIPLGIPYVINIFLLADVTSNTLYWFGLLGNNILLLLASGWIFVIFARTYKHALEISLERALTIAIGFFVLSSALFFIVS